MAVTIIQKHKGINGTNLLEHHRNPSGRHNKCKWLLSKAGWNLRKLNDVFYIVCTGNEIDNWSLPYSDAFICLMDIKRMNEQTINSLKAWRDQHKKPLPVRIVKCLILLLDYIEKENRLI